MEDDWKKRLQRILDARNLNMKELSLIAGGGRNETMIRDALKRTASPKLSTLLTISKALNISLSELVEGDNIPFQQIPVIGAVSAGGNWTPIDDGGHDPLELHIDGDAIALVVTGDSMAPVYNAGDMIIGVRRTGVAIARYIGRDCIVLTETGDRYLKYLRKGSIRGRFTLRSHNPTHDDIVDAALSWAAPVEWRKISI